MAQIKQQTAPRPRTHAAWAETITQLGGELQDVLLDRREGEDWWMAKLRIIKDGRLIRLDGACQRRIHPCGDTWSSDFRR